MRIELGYPDAAHERQLLLGQDRRDLLATLSATLRPRHSSRCRLVSAKVHAAPALLDYVQALVAYTRASGEFITGLSPRAAIGLLRASQSWALLAGRAAVVPEDVQAVLPAVVGHRLRISASQGPQLHRAAAAALSRTCPFPEARNADLAPAYRRSRSRSALGAPAPRT